MDSPACTHVKYKIKDDVAVVMINNPTSRVCVCFQALVIVTVIRFVNHIHFVGSA